jgi:hypothetical protein
MVRELYGKIDTASRNHRREGISANTSNQSRARDTALLSAIAANSRRRGIRSDNATNRDKHRKRSEGALIEMDGQYLCWTICGCALPRELGTIL